MTSQWRKLLFRSFLGLVALIALAGLSLATMLWSDWGRARVCRSVTEAITAEIAGRIEVQSFDELSLDRVRAHGVKIFAPDGKLAIEAESAVIDFDLIDLIEGRYGWSRADIKNGKVYVTEDSSGRINMEETFRARVPDTSASPPAAVPADGPSRLDLRNMITSDILLVIGGGSLPKLRLVNLYGIMRVHVLADGTVELRFDEYRGNFVRGLPTGTLVFSDVAGQVIPSHKRLLHFDGRGKTEGAAVSFRLDIFTEPEKLVKIDARFPKLTPAALPTLGVATWSKFSKTLDVDVSFGS